MSLQNSVYPAQPDLADLLNLWKKDVMLSLNCHHIGTIQSFNQNSQTCSATINYSKIYFQQNTATGVNEPIKVDYPVLADCPVIVLGGGSSSLTFPIQAGDECLVLFNDRNLDNWLAFGAGQTINNLRTHSFADGIILVGLRSAGKVISNYSLSHAVLQNGSTQVGVGSSTINVSNTMTSLGTILTDLTTALATFSSGLNPTNLSGKATALNVTITTATTGIAALIGSLLE